MAIIKIVEHWLLLEIAMLPFSYKIVVQVPKK